MRTDSFSNKSIVAKLGSFANQSELVAMIKTVRKLFYNNYIEKI